MKMLIIIVAMLIFDVSESSSKEQLIFWLVTVTTQN
jgi:hypothetical protein